MKTLKNVNFKRDFVPFLNRMDILDLNLKKAKERVHFLRHHRIP